MAFSGPSCRWVLAFDDDVVARLSTLGPILHGAADGCSIFGKFSVFVMRAVGSCTSAPFATTGRSTVRRRAISGNGQRAEPPPSGATGRVSTAGGPRLDASLGCALGGPVGRKM
jgi:hypothetical protein